MHLHSENVMSATIWLGIPTVMYTATLTCVQTMLMSPNREEVLSIQLDLSRVAPKSRRAGNLSQTQTRAGKALPSGQVLSSSNIWLQKHGLLMDMSMSAHHVSLLAQRRWIS